MLNEEDYIIKITQTPKLQPEKVESVTQENLIGQSEQTKLLIEFQKIETEIALNKKNLTLNLIENEQLLDNLTNDREIFINRLKSERLNANKIINNAFLENR